MTTRYTIPTDPDYWGGANDSSLDGDSIARTVTDLVEIYCERNGYQVSVDIVPETFSYNNQASGNEEIIDDLSSLVDIGSDYRREFTADELGKVLGISSRQVRNLAREFGKGKQIGNQWMFSMAEALELMHRPKPGPKPRPVA